MRIVTTTSVFPQNYFSDLALKRLATVGFSNLDMGFDYCTSAEHPFCGKDWREWARSLRTCADSLGVTYSHAHSGGDASVSMDYMHRALAACVELGIQYLVLHPIFRENGEIITDDEAFLRVNYEAYRTFLSDAEKNGVIILTENLLWGSSILPGVISELVKRVNHPNFGWCLDTGHLNCSGVTLDSVREVSVVPLSLHVQDNHGLPCQDEHLLPGDGTIDWRSFLELLHDIHYQGDLVLEAHHQSLHAPDDQREAILAELLRRAKKMNAYFEAYSMQKHLS